MGRYIRRPNAGTDWGTVETVGSNPLGDNDDATRKAYYDTGGTINTYPKFLSSMIPAGRKIIALRVGHRQVNGGAFNVGNGWPISRLRFTNSRADESIAYKQDGFNTTPRTVEGPPLYKPGEAGPGYWSEDDMNLVTSDIGTNESPAPNKNNKWCIATEVFIAVVYEDNLSAPSISYPAAGATIATSSVNFSANCPAPQPEQPVQAVFQVTQAADFNGDGVSTFIGGLQSSTVAGSKSTFTSDKYKGTYTNLGPGLWRVRSKTRDSWGKESAWSATTTFTISHPALPVPFVSSPAEGSTVTTPYGVRSAQFFALDAGDRKVGMLFQFSKTPDFSSGVIAWANITGGSFDPAVISYNAQPDPSTGPGLFGPRVSPDDPTQYLTQGAWYGRARSVDRWGQFSAWSNTRNFVVAHKPVATPVFPVAGQKFDKDLQLVRWSFADPWSDDLQSAYQVVVIDPASQTVLFDSGKVSSSVPQAKITLPTPRLQETLQWGLVVWDLDDVPSETTAISSMVISKAPVITVTSPLEDEQVQSGQPTITWSNVFARPDVTQKSFELVFRDRATNNTIFTTGKITSAATSYTPPRVILKNLVNVALYVTITDSDDLPNTLIRNFSTNFIRPASVPNYVDPSAFTERGYVSYLYPEASPDAFFVQWNFYRRRVGTTEWILAGSEEDVNVREFRDWLISGSGDYQFGVTQVATRFGSFVESEIDEYAPAYTVRTVYWWLIDPDNEENNLRLPSVVDHHYSLEQESKTFVVRNRGTHENRGTKTGRSGAITVAVRQSAGVGISGLMAMIEDMCDQAMSVLLRDPFGSITKVSIVNKNANAMAGTGEEYGDVEIPFKEVY